MLKTWGAAAVLAFGVWAAAPASAADGAPEGWAYEVANELMSPFCPGRTLADCTSPQAATVKAWLLVQ
jgi:hypothetical protein